MNATESESKRAPMTPSRRGAVRTAAGAAVGALAMLLARAPMDVEARRNACHVRCGGDRRHCRIDCQDWGDAEKACKRGCDTLRDACFELCEFRTIRSRLAR